MLRVPVRSVTNASCRPSGEKSGSAFHHRSRNSGIRLVPDPHYVDVVEGAERDGDPSGDTDGLPMPTTGSEPGASNTRTLFLYAGVVTLECGP